MNDGDHEIESGPPRDDSPFPPVSGRLGRPRRRPRDRRHRGDSVALGVGLAIAAIVAWTVVVAVISWIAQRHDPYGGLWPLIIGMNFGFAQILYMPFILGALVWRKKPQALKGALIVSGTAFMINAACVGIGIVGSSF